MPRFITGDELGNLKAYVPTTEDGSTKVQCSELLLEANKQKSVQKLAIAKSTVRNILCENLYRNALIGRNEEKVASALANGTVLVHSLDDEADLKLTQRHQWKETRLKLGQSFVGLAASEGYAWVLPISQLVHKGTSFQQGDIFLHIKWCPAVDERGRAATQSGCASDAVVLLAVIFG